jgi:hypothetical protein
VPTASGKLREIVFRIDPRETTFARRGFDQGERSRQARLERIGRVFLDGYHAAIAADVAAALARRLDEVEAEVRGFAFEGAAMALALRDALSLRRGRRLATFLKDVAVAHPYTAHVGAGWALARLPPPLHARVQLPDPLLRWLAWDGRGFHDAFFRTSRVIRDRAVSSRLSGYERRAFDQGVGRCLWFHDCADPDRVRSTVREFPAERHADLWSGVGLACAYAGGADRAEIEALVAAAGEHRAHFGQGVAFAAKAHRLAGVSPLHTELACRAVGSTAEALAALCDAALPARAGVGGGARPAYELWRAGVRDRLPSTDAVEPKEAAS